MVFSSEVFLFGFLPFVLLGYCLLARFPAWRDAFLCLASLSFYAWGEPVFVFIMLGTIVLNWGIAQTMAYHARRLFLLIGLVADIGILAVFKYAAFLAENVNSLFHTALPVPGIKLPIGISFFVFQAISYLVDVYRGTVRPQRSLQKVALYISLFPQLIAGPIVRYADIERQISLRNLSFDRYASGCRRFAVGLAKKVLLADRLGELADLCFGIPGDYLVSISSASLWLGALAYAFQILFDFSGYSDMAIGLGRMFGFSFRENFDHPYVSRSVSEFWRRWHISLGNWFRDYVYIPLGGNRVGKTRLVFNLFVVWMLTGLWHGANWTFVFWGLGYFVLISTEKTLRACRWMPPLPAWAARFLTLLAVLLLWVVFRSDSLGYACLYLKRMANAGGGAFVDPAAMWQLRKFAPWMLVAVFCCVDWTTWTNTIRAKFPKSAVIATESHAMVLFLLSLSEITNSSFRPFLYFNF